MREEHEELVALSLFALSHTLLFGKCIKTFYLHPRTRRRIGRKDVPIVGRIGRKNVPIVARD